MFRQQLLKMMFFFLFVFLFHWNHMSFVVFCLKMTRNQLLGYVNGLLETFNLVSDGVQVVPVKASFRRTLSSYIQLHPATEYGTNIFARSPWLDNIFFCYLVNVLVAFVITCSLQP
jgi:hypothetical protein